MSMVLVLGFTPLVLVSTFDMTIPIVMMIVAIEMAVQNDARCGCIFVPVTVATQVGISAIVGSVIATGKAHHQEDQQDKALARA